MIVWGVDVDSRSIHVGAWDTLSPAHLTWTWRWREKSSKGPWQASDLKLMAARLEQGWIVCPEEWHPTIVVVERPTGKHPSPPLFGVWGAVLLWFQINFEWAIVTEVAVSEWKKGIVGHGNASKEQVQAWCNANTDFPLCAVGPVEVDQADALCIGLWARQLELED